MTNVSNRGDGLEVFLNDLSEDAQKEVLRFLGLTDAGEGNLDVEPLFLLPKPVVEEEEEEEEEEENV